MVINLEEYHGDEKIFYNVPRPSELNKVWEAIDYFANNYDNPVEFKMIFKYLDRIMDCYDYNDYITYVDYDSDDSAKWEMKFEKITKEDKRNLAVIETHFHKLLERREKLEAKMREHHE